MDFLWHSVSEKEKEQIKKEAKDILDNFAKKLEPIAGKIKDEPFIERGECERQEDDKKPKASIDRKIMFENAPEKNDYFIIAERGEWK